MLKHNKRKVGVTENWDRKNLNLEHLCTENSNLESKMRYWSIVAYILSWAVKQEGKFWKFTKCTGEGRMNRNPREGITLQ